MLILKILPSTFFRSKIHRFKARITPAPLSLLKKTKKIAVLIASNIFVTKLVNNLITMKIRSIVSPVLSTACRFATTQRNLQGKCTGRVITADSSAYPLTYNFSLAGDSVMGTAKSTLGEFPIEEGKLDTAGLHFKVTVNRLNVYHNGTVYADSIGMNISLNGSMVHCTLNRAAI